MKFNLLNRLASRVTKIAAVLCLAGLVSAQTVSTETVMIGGPGASGSEGGNPPTLSNGTTIGTALLTYTYNQATCDLTILVQNTSPVVTCGPNPVITKVFFNLPQFAVGNICLVSQNAQSLVSYSGCGGWGWGGCGGWGCYGSNLNWSFAKDTNVENGSCLTCGDFGGFGARLKNSSGLSKALANPAAVGQLPWCNSYVGDATFVFHVTGVSAKNLNAAAFTRSLSTGTDQVNAVVMFDTPGCYGPQGCIGNDEKCSSGGWIIGAPIIGQSVYAVETAADGCYGCIICSTEPGPTTAFGITVPVGLPYTVILSQLFPNSSLANVIAVEIPIPNDPAFVGVTYYCATVIVDAATQTAFDISPGYTVTVQAPPQN